MKKINPSEQREDNPFEDKEVAEQWIRSVEGEKGMARDKEIYPMLREWANSIGDGMILEIGSGQGICSEQFSEYKGSYIGVEPSETLTKRAEELYGDNERLKFVVGNAYKLPTDSKSIDGAFSLNVWFHLADLDTASQELARVLKEGARFNIITTNPESYDVWRTFFEDYKEEGNMISGKVNIPVNPLSRNDFYMHTMNEMTGTLEQSGLIVESIKTIGTNTKYPDKPLFVSIQGSKT